MGITLIFPVDESVNTSPDGGEDKTIEYPASPEDIKPLVNGSEFCSQLFWFVEKSETSYQYLLQIT